MWRVISWNIYASTIPGSLTKTTVKSVLLKLPRMPNMQFYEHLKKYSTSVRDTPCEDPIVFEELDHKISIKEMEDAFVMLKRDKSHGTNWIFNACFY